MRRALPMNPHRALWEVLPRWCLSTKAKIASNGKIIIPCCGDKKGPEQFSPHPSLALNYRTHTWQTKFGNAILVGN